MHRCACTVENVHMLYCLRGPLMLKYTSGNIVPGRNALELTETRASLLTSVVLSLIPVFSIFLCLPL